MTTIRKGYVDCSEGQIHYREAGSPENPTVCFPPSDRLALAPCLRRS
jgi:hypothetical protein